MVTDAATWMSKRRPEIVKLFEENEYGRAPGRPADMSFDVFDKGTPAFGGKAMRRQVTVYFSADKSGPQMDLLIYTPAGATKPVPVLLNVSFVANNMAVPDDPGVKVGTRWNPQEKKRVAATRPAFARPAGTQAAGTRPAATRPGGGGFGRLDVMQLINAGYGVATVNYGDIDPDVLGGIPGGVRALYLKPGQTQPAADEWGSIAAWSWGLSRAMDYLETDSAVDAKRVALFGVSRLGKTVLWTGAADQRFALVIASCSGEGGAALSRRNYGETIKLMVEPTRYPYQFAAYWGKYADDPNKSPVDGHMLVALMAPRPVLLQTGDTDRWSDPKGEFLAAVAAEPVYKLFGKEGLGTEVMPGAKEPILHTIGYEMHAGGHGSMPSDWGQYLAFMKMHLMR